MNLRHAAPIDRLRSTNLRERAAIDPSRSSGGADAHALALRISRNMVRAGIAAQIRLLAFLLAFVVACALLPCAPAVAQPLQLPPPPKASLQQHPGAQLPLDLRAADDAGEMHRLGDFFDGEHPVLLVPGYFRCPQLCGLVMHALLESLQESGVPRSGWRIVAFSIDPQETPADARARRELDLAYADFLLGARTPQRRPDLQLLTMQAPQIGQLTQRLGYDFDAQRDGPAKFAHPATVVVVTPRGVVSRYFNGVQFDAPELRVALADAAGDRIGGITSRIALLCAHFDPQVGRHTDAVMNAARTVSLVIVGALALWCWRRRHPGGGMR